jgi:nucleotide-binding universal stress UspA family protein
VNREEHAVDLTRGALALAEDYGAEVELVHALPATDSSDLNAANDEILAIQRRTGTSLKVHLAPGSVRDVIRDSALKFAADLVIIGRGHLQKPFSRLRSHAYSIIKDSPCPVLSC